MSASGISAKSTKSTRSAPPVFVEICQLIDLSLGTPEAGAVNFTLLHALLHVIAKQVNIQNAKIEFRGEDGAAVRTMMECGQKGGSVILSEYVIEKTSGEVSEGAVEEEGKEPEEGAEGEGAEAGSKASETITVVERVEGEEPEEVGSVKSKERSSKRLSVATSSQYNLLQEKVSQLEGQLSDTIPKNKDLLNQTQRGSKSVSEMWQMMNMVARMDAAEMGIEKLSSIIEDLAVMCNKIAQELGLASDTSLTSDVSVDNEDGPKKKRRRGGLEGSTSILGLIDGILNDFDVLKEEVQELSNVFKSFKASIPEELTESNGSGLNMNRISGMDTKFCEINDQISRLDNAFNNQMNIFQDQVTDIEKEVMAIWRNLNDKAAAEARASGVGELTTKILVIQEEMETSNAKVDKLLEDKDDKTLKINMIAEEMDVIKTVKADKREVEDWLEDKADIKLVNTKLSIEQFDIAYNNLFESLNEAHTKLINQEITLRNSLDEMQKDMDLKLYREELTPLRDSLTDKIRRLHERLKVIETMKKEAEAAGTKSKYLKDVNCISCDNKVLMACGEEIPRFPSFKPMPRHPSVQPYISYDLDNMRKARKMVAGQGTEDMQGAMNVCNRYCGGSHTTTTAHQRVQRGGNFTAQFGMQAVPIRGPETARPVSAPQMKDQAIAVQVSLEFKAASRTSVRRHVTSEGAEKPSSQKGSKVSIKGSSKPRSAVSVKDGGDQRGPSQISQKSKGSTQKVDEETAGQDEQEQPPSGAASPSKRGSAEKVPSASGSATGEGEGPAEEQGAEEREEEPPAAREPEPEPEPEGAAPVEEEAVAPEPEADAPAEEEAPAED